MSLIKIIIFHISSFSSSYQIYELLTICWHLLFTDELTIINPETTGETKVIGMMSICHYPNGSEGWCNGILKINWFLTFMVIFSHPFNEIKTWIFLNSSLNLMLKSTYWLNHLDGWGYMLVLQNITLRRNEDT